MRFIKGQMYRVFSASNDHLVISVSKKGEGCLQLAECSTSNPHTGETAGFEDELEYMGRTELEGSKGKVPTFKTPSGTLVKGHPNNFNPDSEYNKDKVRNRSEENAANVKPESIAKSIGSLAKGVIARDAAMALNLVEELAATAQDRVADQVVDGLEAEDAEVEESEAIEAVA